MSDAVLINACAGCGDPTKSPRHLYCSDPCKWRWKSQRRYRRSHPDATAYRPLASRTPPACRICGAATSGHEWPRCAPCAAKARRSNRPLNKGGRRPYDLLRGRELGGLIDRASRVPAGRGIPRVLSHTPCCGWHAAPRVSGAPACYRAHRNLYMRSMYRSSERWQLSYMLGRRVDQAHLPTDLVEVARLRRRLQEQAGLVAKWR